MLPAAAAFRRQGEHNHEKRNRASPSPGTRRKPFGACVPANEDAMFHWIMTRAVTVAFGIALALRVILGTVPADATTFPVVAPGDPMSGIFTLNPNTPLNPPFPPPGFFDRVRIGKGT
jgi:hypothetical protein